MKNFCLPLAILLVTLLAACSDENEPPPPAAQSSPHSIETLWVADQFSGMLGTWMRLQQRWLITSSSICSQSLDLRQGSGTRVEIYTDESVIVNHLTSEHGGVIELRPIGGSLLTITREFNDDTDQWTEPYRFAEKFEREEDWENSFLLYRWLDDGQADLITVYREEGPDAPTLDPAALLASVADAEAFDDLRWADEESLLASDPIFVNHTRLHTLTSTLKEFSVNSETAFEEVSTELDKKWKDLPESGDPERLGGIGLFTSTHRFGNIFRKSMIEAGYNPYTGSFAFSGAQMAESMGTDLSDDDRETLKTLQTQFDPFVELFEGSLRELINATAPPEKFPTFTNAQDFLNSAEPSYGEADGDEEETLPPAPPPPTVQ